MVSYIQEDLDIVNHSDKPPLHFNVPTSTLDSTKNILQACLCHKLENEFLLAQAKGWIPGDAHLIKNCPSFQEARQEDASYIENMKLNAAKREEARKIAQEEARRAEEERQARLQREKEAEALRRREEKELRRQQRILAKIEARAQSRADEQRRYEELHGRWETLLDECTVAVEDAENTIATATDTKKDLEEKTKAAHQRKADLLQQLREIATRKSQNTSQAPAELSRMEGIETAASLPATKSITSVPASDIHNLDHRYLSWQQHRSGNPPPFSPQQHQQPQQPQRTASYTTEFPHSSSGPSRHYHKEETTREYSDRPYHHHKDSHRNIPPSGTSPRLDEVDPGTNNAIDRDRHQHHHYPQPPFMQGRRGGRYAGRRPLSAGGLSGRGHSFRSGEYHGGNAHGDNEHQQHAYQQQQQQHDDHQEHRRRRHASDGDERDVDLRQQLHDGKDIDRYYSGGGGRFSGPSMRSGMRGGRGPAWGGRGGIRYMNTNSNNKRY